MAKHFVDKVNMDVLEEWLAVVQENPTYKLNFQKTQLIDALRNRTPNERVAESLKIKPVMVKDEYLETIHYIIKSYIVLTVGFQELTNFHTYKLKIIHY